MLGIFLHEQISTESLYVDRAFIMIDNKERKEEKINVHQSKRYFKKSRL